MPYLGKIFLGDLSILNNFMESLKKRYESDKNADYSDKH
jgi:hypothetical protein